MKMGRKDEDGKDEDDLPNLSLFLLHFKNCRPRKGRNIFKTGAMISLKLSAHFTAKLLCM